MKKSIYLFFQHCDPILDPLRLGVHWNKSILGARCNWFVRLSSSHLILFAIATLRGPRLLRVSLFLHLKIRMKESWWIVFGICILRALRKWNRIDCGITGMNKSLLTYLRSRSGRQRCLHFRCLFQAMERHHNLNKFNNFIS